MNEKIKAQDMECRVIENRPLTPTVFQLSFHTSLPLQFKAGQFMSVIVPGAGPKGRDLRRAYSIASFPENSVTQLCIKLVEGGPGTNYLLKLKAGDVFRSTAPFGEFTYKTTPDRSVIFFATGTGISPFRSMILSSSYKSAQPKTALCLQGVREENELLYLDELGALPGLKMVTAVSRPKDAAFQFKGRVTDYIRLHAKEIDWANTDYYLCGGGSMIDEVKLILAEHGVQKPQIHQEVYYKTAKEAESVGNA